MLNQRYARWFCLLAVAAIGRGGAAIGADSNSPDTHKVNFHIAQQPVGDALTQFGEQSGLAIGVPAALSHGVTARPLDGDYTLDEALAKLLGPIGLRAEYVDNKTITIRAAQTVQGRPSTSQDNMRDEATASTAELNAIPSSASPLIAEARKTQSTNNSNTSAPGGELDEVVVTGSRLKRAGAEAPSPVVVFDRDKIDRSGASNVADVLASLPQQSFSNDERFNTAGSRTVRLRGLGLGTTLVLINGRRTISSALTEAGNYFDINTIPLSAVQRIEVLSDSAAAVYGTDAVGGVINIILKKEIDQPELDLSYGAADEGARERRASLAAGHSSQRVRASLILDAFDRGYLYGNSRDLFANQNFTRFDSLDRRVPTADPGNICTASGANLPGLPFPCAAVPIGSPGVGLKPANFTSTAGQTNLVSLDRFSSVVPKSSRVSAFATVSIDVTDGISAFAELMYADRKDQSLQYPATLTSALVPATNAFNPFGVPVRANYLLEGLGVQSSLSKAQSTRAVAGLTGRLSTWDWEISGMEIDERASSALLNSPNASAITASLASADPSQALNVFQDGLGGSESLLQSLTAAPVINSDRSEATQIGGLLRGSLLQLWAGPMTAAVGGEVRRELLHFEANPTIDFSASRKTGALYSEVHVPLVASDHAITILHSLELDAAVRFDHYNDFGGTVNGEYGLMWHPTSDLLLRGTYGTGFRAPSLYQLYSPFSVSPGSVIDPERGNTAVPVTFERGGNPDLQPERSSSVTAGFSWRPSTWRGFQCDTTYWRINQRSTIQTLLPTVILANESLFPDRVVRAPPTPADIAAGRPGSLVSINFNNVNFGTISTDGADFSIEAPFQTKVGVFTPMLLATRVDSFKAAQVPAAAPTERVGVASLTSGTIPRWRESLTINWRLKNVDVSATGRGISSYKDASTLGVINGRTIPWQTFLDLQASLNFAGMEVRGHAIFSGFQVRVGAINVLNKAPPFAEVGGTLGFDPSQSDTRQRFVYVSAVATL